MVNIPLGPFFIDLHFSNNENEPSFISNSTTTTFNYSCSSSTSCGFFQFLLPKGIYLLQVWGSQGGKGSHSLNKPGGLGGYSRGVLILHDSFNVFVYVGGAGTTGGLGGFNGGGSVSAASVAGGSGGGSSDIRLISDSLYHRIIVGGGGGGTEYSNNIVTTSHGGGFEGGKGKGNRPENAGQGGTQSSPGVFGNSGGSNGDFGLGGNVSGGHRGGGGGGWYGGGGGGIDGDGGGGSGFVFNAATQSFVPSGYQLTSEFLLSDSYTIHGNSAFPSPYSPFLNETGHSGNGAVSITVIAPKDDYINHSENLLRDYSDAIYMHFIMIVLGSL